MHHVQLLQKGKDMESVVIISRAAVVAALLLAGAGCSTTAAYKPYGARLAPYTGEVRVIPLDESAPNSCSRLGEVHIYDAGLAVSCGYDAVLEKARQKTGQQGGNFFHITRVSAPNFWTSTCYRIRGESLLCK